jgi:hypothetical protein
VSLTKAAYGFSSGTYAGVDIVAYLIEGEAAVMFANYCYGKACIVCC